MEVRIVVKLLLEFLVPTFSLSPKMNQLIKTLSFSLSPSLAVK